MGALPCLGECKMAKSVVVTFKTATGADMEDRFDLETPAEITRWAKLLEKNTQTGVVLSRNVIKQAILSVLGLQND